MTKTELDAERAHHARLDKMAGECSERSQAGRDHLDCAYCAHLAAFYKDQRVILQGGKVKP